VTPRRALISGITGQDGSYLAELLLDKGYEVHGLVRRSSSFSTGRIEHLYRDPHDENVRLRLHYSDLTDSSSLVTTLNRVRPDEVYNLGAQSHVMVSFEMPEFTADTTGMGTLRLLGNPLQPRVTPPRARVRDAQGHERGGRDQARAAGEASAPPRRRSPRSRG